jgi:hypothetical protein
MANEIATTQYSQKTNHSLQFAVIAILQTLNEYRVHPWQNYFFGYLLNVTSVILAVRNFILL